MGSLKKKASDVKLNSTEDIVRFMLESDEEISDCSSSDFDDVIDGTDISTEEDSDDDMEKSIAENNQSIVTQPVSFVVPIKKRQRMTTKKKKLWIIYVGQNVNLYQVCVGKYFIVSQVSTSL